MKRSSTIFLKAVILFIGILVLIFCFFLLIPTFKPENADYLPHLITIYLSAASLLFALFQAMKLLTLIDKNKAFSELSLKSLKYIKYSAIAISAMLVIVMPYVYYKADLDDAPGPLAIALILMSAAIVSTAFAAVLQKLVQNGMEIKSENDLTV